MIQRSRHRGSLATMLIIVALVLGATPERILADTPFPPEAMSYPSGKITGLYQTTLQIDGRTYSLTPEAVLVDRHGDPLEAQHLRVDIDVRYHLQKGTTDKIDWMLLILPE